MSSQFHLLHSESTTVLYRLIVFLLIFDLYALDFDGVLCYNCGESSLTTVKAAKMRWPTLFDGVDSVLEDWIVEQMHIVRPVVETGYENLLLVRLLLEIKIPALRKSSVAEGLTVDGILVNWPKIKPVIMEEWGEERDELVDLFGKIRDEWIEKDLPTWIGANRQCTRRQSARIKSEHQPAEKFIDIESTKLPASNSLDIPS